MEKIIDISTWNGAIDFDKVKAAGINGVILRAGFGNGTVDNEFIGNINRAIDAGIKYIGA
jgi:GH25 family lysozyme M1 (1,4-beta-N-acetylmuramidase)